jgi:hypothetical protein
MFSISRKKEKRENEKEGADASAVGKGIKSKE